MPPPRVPTVSNSNATANSASTSTATSASASSSPQKPSKPMSPPPPKAPPPSASQSSPSKSVSSQASASASTSLLPSTTNPTPALAVPSSASSSSLSLSTTVPPATRRTREGDAHWLRIMETKENQWRLLHTLTLHEMNARERHACAELDTLSARLENLSTACARTERTVKRCRAHRFRQQLVRLAAKPVQQAAAHLTVARYAAVARPLADAEAAVPVKTDAAALQVELERFAEAAGRFRHTAGQTGVTQLTSLADMLEKLAATVASESAVVADTAAQVSHAAHQSEMARTVPPALMTPMLSTWIHVDHIVYASFPSHPLRRRRKQLCDHFYLRRPSASPAMVILHGRAITNIREVDPDERANNIAKPGDLVIIHEHYTTLRPLTLQRDSLFNNRFGTFAHNAALDNTLGRRLYSTTSPSVNANATSGKTVSAPRAMTAGFVHVLRPTPELWSQAMSHRTQIVYPHDAALITFLLELRPGATMVESGTGSGAASVAFARTVAPGRVHTFDFHKQRAEAARRDFVLLGLSDVISVKGGVDVTKDGFVGVSDASADAVFLDLPVPYLMGDEVYRVLREDGAVCMFSPCIEQVQRTCAMLRQSGFYSVRTVTAPVKTYETREMKLETPGFDDGDVAAASSSDEAVVAHGVKRLRGDDGAKPVSERQLRMRNRTAGAERLAVMAMQGERHHVGRVVRPNIRLHSRPFSVMKGHTSYLTFARKCTHFTSGQHNGGGRATNDRDRDNVGSGGAAAGADGFATTGDMLAARGRREEQDGIRDGNSAEWKGDTVDKEHDVSRDCRIT